MYNLLPSKTKHIFENFIGSATVLSRYPDALIFPLDSSTQK